MADADPDSVPGRDVATCLENTPNPVLPTTRGPRYRHLPSLARERGRASRRCQARGVYFGSANRRTRTGASTASARFERPVEGGGRAVSGVRCHTSGRAGRGREATNQKTDYAHVHPPRVYDFLVAGGDGYVERPPRCERSRTDERVLLVDNFARRGWVDDVGATSATPVASIDERLDAAREVHGLTNLSFVEGDLAEKSSSMNCWRSTNRSRGPHRRAAVRAVLPINGERANYTQHDNLQATRNLRGASKNTASPTPTSSRRRRRASTPRRRPGSPRAGRRGAWRARRGPSTTGRELVPRDEGFRRTEHAAGSHAVRRPSRTCVGLVSGPKSGNPARPQDSFDFDYNFGSVAHGSCAQAVAGYPVTVLTATRLPLISFADSVDGLAAFAPDRPRRVAFEALPGRHTRHRLRDRRDDCRCGQRVRPRCCCRALREPPRRGRDPQMEIENDRYADLIGGQSQSFEDGVDDIFGTLTRCADAIEAHEDRFLPGVLSED